MSFTDWRRERFIHGVLRKLSHQRVSVILQPGNVWVIENAIERKDNVEEALRTCYLRGWVEPIENAVPRGTLTKDGRLPPGQVFDEVGPIYRLTDGGWHAINQTHSWVFLTFCVAVATLLASGLGVVIAMFPNKQ